MSLQHANHDQSKGPLGKLKFSTWISTGVTTASWAVKHILLPMSPFLFGAAVRFFQSHSTDLSIFDPAQMSFSLALLCILVASSTHRVTRDDNAGCLVNVLYFLACFYVLIFAVVSVWQSELTGQLLNLYDVVDSFVRQGAKDITGITMQMARVDPVEYAQRMEKARLAAFFAATIAIPVSIACKYIYKLED